MRHRSTGPHLGPPPASPALASARSPPIDEPELVTSELRAAFRPMRKNVPLGTGE